MARLGNVHALLDAMIEQAKIEDALNRIDANTAELGSSFINLARDLGVPEDKIIEALSQPGR
jgi:hypothetical protein